MFPFKTLSNEPNNLYIVETTPQQEHRKSDGQQRERLLLHNHSGGTPPLGARPPTLQLPHSPEKRGQLGIGGVDSPDIRGRTQPTTHANPSTGRGGTHCITKRNPRTSASTHAPLKKTTTTTTVIAGVEEAEEVEKTEGEEEQEEEEDPEHKTPAKGRQLSSRDTTANKRDRIPMS